MNALTRIVDTRRAAVAEAKRVRPIAALREALPLAGPCRPFGDALRRPGLSAIAEIKRSAPSSGALRPGADAGALAAAYAAAGARALSVLTEPDFFGGRLQDIVAARDAAPLPVLRKDFVVDPYQIAEARAAGADAVLLIVAVLGARTREFLAHAAAAGLDALVEVHDEAELRLALDAGAAIVGVNNRNLADLSIDLATTERLAPLMPDGVTLVAESGIAAPADARRMRAAGAAAILVGSALMRSDDPGAALTALLAAAEEEAVP